MKSDLVDAKAFKKTSEKELEKLMIELHSSQLQNQKLKTSSTSQTAADEAVNLIQKKLHEELERRFSVENPHFNIALLEEQLNDFKRENESLKLQNVNLTSEI